MTRLETYCKHVVRTKGMGHIIALDGLRLYLKATNPERLITEMNKIVEPELLRAMQEAGVPNSIWDEYIKKLEEVF